MVRDKVSMFPELRAVQIEVPRDVLEMLEGSGEAPAHQAGASFSTGCAHRREDPWESRATFLMEPFGALPSKVAEANLLKNMVGRADSNRRPLPCQKTAGSAKVRGSRTRHRTLWVGVWVGNKHGGLAFLYLLIAQINCSRSGFVRPSQSF
jgi:hypothetical protein